MSALFIRKPRGLSEDLALELRVAAKHLFFQVTIENLTSVDELQSASEPTALAPGTTCWKLRIIRTDAATTSL
jgi:hypothetical protein